MLVSCSVSSKQRFKTSFKSPGSQVCHMTCDSRHICVYCLRWRVKLLLLWTVEYHHHQVLLLLVEHRASMKNLQALRSPAIPLTSFHDLPVPLISSSIVLCHVLFGLHLLLYPWRFQFNAVFSIAPTSLRNVCPI